MLIRSAVSPVAEVLGEPRTGTVNCLETGQKSGLFRVGGRGGGKSALHILLSETTSLAMAHGVHPRAALGELVPAFRALPPLDRPGWTTAPALPRDMWQSRGCCFGRAGIELDALRDRVNKLPKHLVNGRWSGEGDHRCYRVLPGDTLGEALDYLTDYISYPMGKSLREALRWSDFAFRMFSSSIASISIKDDTDIGRIEFITYYQIPKTRLSNPPGLSRVSVFNFEVFETLADLWADSRAHLGIDRFPSFPRAAPASANPGSESAETGPRQGAASAHSTDRLSDEGADAPPRTTRDLTDSQGNACARACAIPS